MKSVVVGAMTDMQTLPSRYRDTELVILVYNSHTQPHSWDKVGKESNFRVLLALGYNTTKHDISNILPQKKLDQKG